MILALSLALLQPPTPRPAATSWVATYFLRPGGAARYCRPDGSPYLRP